MDIILKQGDKLRTTKIIKLAKLIKTLENANVYEFKIDTLEDRLKLHKIVYIAKKFGIDVGYSFDGYENGAYSTELANVYDKLAVTIHKNLGALKDENVDRLIEFIRGKSYDELSCISVTLLFLDKLKKKGYMNEELRDMLVTIVGSRKPRLAKKVRQIVDEVLEVIKDEVE